MLIIDNLKFGYSDQSILNGVGFSVNRGELVGLVGPNSSGKTTILKLITNVRIPSGGTIHIHDQRTVSLNANKIAKLVSVVPQNPESPAGITTKELVFLGRTPHQSLLAFHDVDPVGIVNNAMQLTQVIELADRPVATLSGGQRQRAFIAMAIAQDTPVMLFDEPTSHLDLTHQIQVMELIKDLTRTRNQASLLTMHDLTLAAQYCDRLVMLMDGRVLAAGPPKSVLVPTNIEKAYKTKIIVTYHPETGHPVILPAGSNLRLQKAEEGNKIFPEAFKDPRNP